MLWGYFSAAGTGRFVKVEGNMNAAKPGGHSLQENCNLGVYLFSSKTMTPSIQPHKWFKNINYFSTTYHPVVQSTLISAAENPLLSEMWTNIFTMNQCLL